MYLGHVSGRKVVPDCRRLGSSASDCRLQKGYPLCACQHTDTIMTTPFAEDAFNKTGLI